MIELSRVSPDWGEALRAVDPGIGQALTALDARLEAEVAAGRGFVPAPDRVLAAFERPLADVRVLLVGQDPYPTPGHAVGLSFSTAPDVRPVPRSLANVYAELADDLGCTPPSDGDLTPWADQGVLLLNRVLTTSRGDAGVHRGWGWERVTDAAVEALVRRGGPCVALLWGRDARALVPRLGLMPRVESAHPSPLSARRGFFGSRPFSRVNALLEEQGAEPIRWAPARCPTRRTS